MYIDQSGKQQAEGKHVVWCQNKYQQIVLSVTRIRSVKLGTSKIHLMYVCMLYVHTYFVKKPSRWLLLSQQLGGLLRIHSSHSSNHKAC